MDSVWKLVRALGCLPYIKDVIDVLCRPRPPLPNLVLQLEVRDEDLEDNFLPNLAVKWNPAGARLGDNLSVTEFFKNKSSRIPESQDKLTLDPIFYILVTLASDRVV